MFNFFIIMDEIQGNNIARNFSSEYFNYTINFIISKEFPALTDFPDFSLILCDLDKNIELAKKHNLPVIAFSHKNNRQESLMGTPWLILATDALSPFFLNEVYCRHYKKPLTITTTNRCIIRELTTRQLPELLQLQEENKNNPSGCFFPQNCTTYAGHTFATSLLEADVDIRYIQEMLGHSSINITEIYTHVAMSKQRDILIAKHPRKNFKI